jgi:hypothetical protein
MAVTGRTSGILVDARKNASELSLNVDAEHYGNRRHM